MTARLPLKLGSSDAKGDDVTHWGRWFEKKYKSYAAPVDGYFGNAEAAATRELQRRLGLPITGVFDQATANKAGYTAVPFPDARRKIWMYTAPGSGADWWIGPSFELGKQCQDVLKLNHQPIGFPKGGYLGLLGGDPALSYIDVITAQRNELARLLRTNPDINDPAVELWFSGYSQSADGMLEAVHVLFGDGGEFAHLRPRINGLILFGNPATQGTGIANKVFPDWLNRLTRNINHPNDFYAVATDKIRRLMYEWFIEAETEIPFVVYSAQIILPAIANLMPGIGLVISAPLSMLLSVIPGGTAGAAKKPNPELVRLLSIQGLLTSLPDLIGLITALPGLQAHGIYDHRPGFDIVAAFRR